MTKSPKGKRLAVSPSLRSKFFPGRFRQSSAGSNAASPTAVVSPSLDASSSPVSPDSSSAAGAPASLLDCLALATPPGGISGPAEERVERVELEDPSTTLQTGGARRPSGDDSVAEILSRSTGSPSTPKAHDTSPTESAKPLPQLPTPSIESTQTSWLDGRNSGASSEVDGRSTSTKQELAISPLESPLDIHKIDRSSDASVAAGLNRRETPKGWREQPPNIGLRDLTEGLDSLGYRNLAQDRSQGSTELSPTSKEQILAGLDPAAAVAPSQNPRFQVLEPSPPPPIDARRLYNAEDPEQILRKQSLANQRDHQLVRSLLQTHEHRSLHSRHNSSVHEAGIHSSFERTMVHRKIWVKRPGASATLVQISEDDLVDDVRDMILKKYANSLGRSFDAPDVTLRIVSREHSHSHRHAPAERVLGPEEHMTRTLDTYYPGGQTVDEALIIDVPMRRTPRHSPRVALPYYSSAAEDMRPAETDQGYFPPIQPGNLPSPLPAGSVSGGSDRHGHQHHHSISILNTGMIPPIPSPGSRAARAGHRPRVARNNTSSPTAITSQPSLPDNRLHNNAPNPPPLPTPPSSNPPPARTSTPPPRTQSPRPQKQKRSSKRNTNLSGAPTSQPGPLLDGSVPAINVLIVEDNIINLKLLEAFMKRLKVRWHTAMNGRDAVTKWKTGGFHLVLMDIQLPIMNGLEATKEIRRLERCNGVGVLAASEQASAEEVSDKDRLDNLELFKSSVIIVALTASSLQSDRHEALAAGCNDFLTKALIDFDGWRKWKAPPAPGGTAHTPAKKTDTKSKSSSTPSSQPTSPRLHAKSQFSPVPDFSGRTGARAGDTASSGSSEHSNHDTSSSTKRGGAQAATHASGSTKDQSPPPPPKPDVTVQSPTPPPSRSSATGPPSSSPSMGPTAPAGNSAPTASSSIENALPPPAVTVASVPPRKPSPLQQSASAGSPPLNSGVLDSAADDSGSGGGSPSSLRNGSAGGPAKQWSPREENRRAKRASLGLSERGALSGVREESGEWDVDVTVPMEENGKARGGGAGGEVDVSA